ncbi:hypothetical protein GCG54_00012176 [Colletotrichum gloeosporioides]|uniref:Uncharacterized protein n=1 Tax=Colletotrichum gloeosporioides TaxID=474922 RepID=A0A8H4CJ97_COLGL|nr:uncharacterized protein GCG54_00012176 [Colletotrichum gloeosporioides]KAF3804687.1 hypothetical protein GCG54_00012176 [Colletotrichum gloeosporioides]
MWAVQPQYHVVDNITKLTKMAREGGCPTVDSDIQSSFYGLHSRAKSASPAAYRNRRPLRPFPTSDAGPEHQDSCHPQGPDRTYPARGKKIDGTSGSEAHTRTHTMTKSDDTRMGV